MNDSVQGDSVRQLRGEIARLEKVVKVLIERAETANDRLPTDFGVFQMMVLLEDKVRSRTQEINAAMRKLEEANRALHESQAKFQAVFDLMPDPVALSTPDGHLLDVSRSFADFFGFGLTEMIGGKTGPEDLALWADPDDRMRFLAAIEAGCGMVSGFECCARRKDGQLAHVAISSRVVNVDGVNLLLSEFHDVTEARRQGQHLRTLAEHDALTGLPNRLLLLDRLQQALLLARRDRSPLAVCYLDLDGFKAVNDGFGHQAGDQVLVETAQRLLAAVRASDTVARLGGDEFAILLQRVSGAEELGKVLQRVLTAIRRPYELDDGRSGNIGVSIGFTLFPDDDAPAQLLLNHADQAMYQAKHAGKNCFRAFAGSAAQI